MQPKDNKPSVSGLPASAIQKGTFRLKLSVDGVKKGYLDKDAEGYAVLSEHGGLTLTYYDHKSEHYLQIPGTELFMAVLSGYYIGFKKIEEATTVRVEDHHLIENQDNYKLSLDEGEDYLFFWDSYTVLEVDFETHK